MYWFVIVLALWSCSQTNEIFGKEKHVLELFHTGVQASKEKRYDQALRSFLEAQNLDPQSKSIRNQIIETRFFLKDYQDLPWLIEHNRKHPSDLDTIKLLRQYHCIQKDELCSQFEKILFLRENKP